MSTAIAPISPPTTHRASTGSTFTNTGALLRFALRRDRIRGLIWVAGLSVFVPYVMAAYDTVFANPQDKEAILGMLANPTLALFTGPGYGVDTVAATSDDVIQIIVASVYWLYLLVLVALMNIFLVVRHTRAEEQAGRTELVRADVVGRNAPLTAALLLVTIANLLVGAFTAAALVGFGSDATSSLLMGGTTALLGLFFAGVAAVAAQLSAFSSSASGIAGAVLGAAFLVRGIGDMLAPAGEHGTWLSWLSPLAWAQQTAPFVLDRFWPALLLAGGAAVLIAVAFALENRRDLGAGLLKVRAGRASAGAWLRSPLALAWAIQRPQVMGWGIGLGIAALVYGSFTGAMVDSFAELPDIFQDLMGGATGALVGYLTLTMTMFRIVLAAYVVVAVGKVMAEERDGRAEPVLATSVTPRGWLGAHLVVIALASAVIQVVVGAIAGVFAAVEDGSASWIGDGMAAGAAGIPGVWMVLGLAAALYALSPRLLTLAWIPVVLGGLIDMFGDLLNLPEWARQISPFEHTPRMPTEPFEMVPILVQLGIAVVLIGVGLWRFGRRDIPTT